MDLSGHLDAAVSAAEGEADGHLTLYRFTTGWKAFLGTPDAYSLDREAIHPVPGYASAAEALEHVNRLPRVGAFIDEQ